MAGTNGTGMQMWIPAILIVVGVSAMAGVAFMHGSASDPSEGEVSALSEVGESPFLMTCSVASNSPLILVDGVEYGSMLDIPASDIESMDVLKDASSTAIYGCRAPNAVIFA